MSRAADYVPYRFYRICPEDSHTCAVRECLAGSPECPRAVTVPATRAPTNAGSVFATCVTCITTYACEQARSCYAHPYPGGGTGMAPTNTGGPTAPGSAPAPQPGRGWDDYGDWS